VLPDVGHVPQLEAPRDCADAVLGWLDASGRPAVLSATAAAPTLARLSIRRWHLPRKSSRRGKQAMLPRIES
jgi:hypothetical protein